MRNAQSEILKFWFEETKSAQWFQKNPDFDAEIIARFESDYNLASQGMYDGWMNSDKGCLALIILLDQFPRNMFRDTSQMFATDHKALTIAKHAVDKQFDQAMNLHEKVFTYLPFEHSEDIKDQEQSLKLFERTKNEDPTFYDYAIRHYDVIEKFGRFPHRNNILKRDNTQMEEDYLAQPNSGF